MTVQPSLSLLQALRLLFKFRRFLVICSVVGVLVGGGLFLGFQTHVATLQFIPESSNSGASRLLGLAAQFGFGGSAGDAEDTPDFYKRLILSRGFLESIAVSELSFKVAADSDSVWRGTLRDYLEPEEEVARRTRAAIRDLTRAIAVVIDPDAGSVSIQVTAGEAGAAEAIARLIVDSVNGFNVSQRQSRAAAERKFVQERLAEANIALDSSEAALLQFLSGNRSLGGSPMLSYQHDLLQREVQQRQALVTSLQDALESARIDEIRDTPVITVFDPPERSAKPGRSLIVNAVGGGLLFTGLGVLLLLGTRLLIGLLDELGLTLPRMVQWIDGAVRSS